MGRLLVGCDRTDVLRGNPNFHLATHADLGRLPFLDRSFDVIFARYVLEHLERPEDVFTELARVLKPGGRLIVLTPSKYHYVAVAGRWTPFWVHRAVSVLRGDSRQDVFPTRYRANSRADLTRLASAAGLLMIEIRAKEASPNYLLWSLPAFLLGVAYERLVNRFEWLAPFRSSIIAAFERP